ncbi:Di-copper centre-containing protein [Lentithecium fluviatile CBS 122367]|uniref:tyrosinase n=1 Tax=Lentithecium fluviatile CBS 122367 TaxID=1168545 RepID=A0A6G1IV16_9PLEO|nr:Di-copper centre-containing protein [Lentithecium fluviatile CBS 122367]
MPGRPHIRHEIRDLKDNYPDHWNLYILALRAFQQMDQSNPLSSYKILGIHGKPYEIWQEAEGVANPGPGSYCPHSNIMFATWHRPYLALFEQELWKQVKAIAEEALVDRKQWLAAADSFRIPYFDSGLGIKGGELPDFFTNPYISVTGPDGVPNVIPNPLFQYEFHPVIPEDFNEKWAQMSTTVRYPTTKDSKGQSQPQFFRQNFFGARRMFQNKAAEVFRLSNYNEFVTALEEFHGWMHSTVGGAEGHFYPVEYSAFDPVFMLHHAHVDRYVAIFQAMHPETWVEPADSNGGNFWQPAHATVDATWGLQPFWKDDQSFYSSDDIRDTAVFGYAYPETQPWNYMSEEDWRNAVRAYVALTYSPTARSTLTESDTQGGTSLAHLLMDDTFVDWSIAITASTKYLPGTFHVVFSFDGQGSVDDGSSMVGQWMQLRPEGANGAWKAKREGRGTKRINSLERTKNGTLSVTSSLLDEVAAGRLESLDEGVVVPFLKEHLTWSVIGEGGSQLGGDELDVFVIEVISTNVRIPKDPAQMLQYSDEVTAHPEVTEGKPGGSRPML